MTVTELIDKLKDCDPNDHMTFYYLQNDILLNFHRTQVPNRSWVLVLVLNLVPEL